jgi:hypothetical protein
MDWFWNWAVNVSGIGTGTACSLIKLELRIIVGKPEQAR